jgi:hypothetical protein
MTGLVVAIWAVYTWTAEQRKSSEDRVKESERQAIVRLFEARKPFLDKHLALYVETAQVVGRLVSNSRGGKWDEDFLRYEQLFWTELSMVEDDGVKAAMQNFAEKLRWIAANPSHVQDADREELKQRSYRLAKALRAGIEETWRLDLSKGATAK